MTSEEKVKRVYPDAKVCVFPVGGDCSYVEVILRLGCARGSDFGKTDLKSHAWDDAWRNIQAQQSAGGNAHVSSTSGSQ